MNNQKEIVEDIQHLLDTYGITIDDIVNLYNKKMKTNESCKKRKIQYYNDERQGIWTYFISGERNPCGCGSNCYHYEYDAVDKKIYGVCNACNSDIYEVKEEYVTERLSEGTWR